MGTRRSSLIVFLLSGTDIGLSGGFRGGLPRTSSSPSSSSRLVMRSVSTCGAWSPTALCSARTTLTLCHSLFFPMTSTLGRSSSFSMTSTLGWSVIFALSLLGQGHCWCSCPAVSLYACLSMRDGEQLAMAPAWAAICLAKQIAVALTS